MLEAEKLSAYVERLSRLQLQPEDDVGFTDAILLAFELGLVDDELLAHRMSMSRSSVGRWKAGRNTPHPAIRRGIYSWLKGRAELALEALSWCKTCIYCTSQPDDLGPGCSCAHAPCVHDINRQRAEAAKKG